MNLTFTKVESNVRLGPNKHGCADAAEIILVEELCLKDESVQTAVAKLKLPQGAIVVADPWIYGIFQPSQHLTLPWT